jgi:hypothetical protein
MRGVVLMILAFLALAAVLSPARQFVPLPTKPMPAVNVPE